MPKLKMTPKIIRPFLFHGVDLNWEEREQALGDCPWCGKERKFFVNLETGLWDCKVCGEKGNVHTFLRKLHEESLLQGTHRYEELAAQRRLLSPDTLKAWGLCQSFLTDDWLVPGYNPEGKICNLYTYRPGPAGHWLLYATPTLTHQLFGVNLCPSNYETLYLCEGPWDAMALWELLGQARTTEEGRWQLTGNPMACLLHKSAVLAVPGCGAIGQPFERWTKLFRNLKNLVFLFDSDHPRVQPKTDHLLEPAGLSATQRACQLLTKMEQPPSLVTYLNWGPEGYDPSQPSGYDLRDALTGSPGRPLALAQRLSKGQQIFEKLAPVPTEWIGQSEEHGSNGSVELSLLTCEDWPTLCLSWRKALKWTNDLDTTLTFMLACVISTEQAGDQLWGKIVGPASCGKSTLCEALSVCKKYVAPLSTITGFHSGYKTDGAGDTDHSLLALINNKTLVTKDGDTLLQSKNRDQILSEARDIYDRVSRAHYRNSINRHYTSLNVTWLLCGTSALRMLDNSELGERFLDCVITEDISEELEREIGWRVANRADLEVDITVNGQAEGREGPEMIQAKRLTGGYVSYLRQNAARLIGAVHNPDQAKRRCQDFGEFIAFLRSRPSKRQDEKTEREMSFRLISQLVRLSKCLAAVLGKTLVDEEVMRRVRKVALDTARGRTFNLVQRMYEAGATGTFVATIARKTGHSEDEERKLLRHLQKIKAAELSQPASPHLNTRPRWRLTSRLSRLYQEVVLLGE